MQPISVPFQIDTTDKKKFIGIGVLQFRAFFKLVFEYCKQGKMYVFTVKEMTAAEVHRNYFHLCMFVAAKEIGITPTQLKAFFDEQVLQRSVEGDNNFPVEDWVIDVIDFKTGEVLKKDVPTFSAWNTTMLRNYIEFVQFSIIETYPNFVFPDSKDFKGEVKGKKNALLFPEAEYVFNF